MFSNDWLMRFWSVLSVLSLSTVSVVLSVKLSLNSASCCSVLCLFGLSRF